MSPSGARTTIPGACSTIQPLADNRSAEPSCLEVDSPEFKAAVERARVDVDCAPEMMARARVGGGLDRASACSPG